MQQRYYRGMAPAVAGLDFSAVESRVLAHQEHQKKYTPLYGSYGYGLSAKHPFAVAIGALIHQMYPTKMEGETRQKFFARRKPFVIARSRMMVSLREGRFQHSLSIARKRGIAAEFISLAALVEPKILEGLDLAGMQPETAPEPKPES